MSVDALTEAVKAAAEKEHIRIGGRVALDPNWRCWSTTPTTGVAR